MSNTETLLQSGLLSDEHELSPAEKAAVESLTEEELDALLHEPRSAGRKGVPTFHVGF